MHGGGGTSHWGAQKKNLQGLTQLLVTLVAKKEQSRAGNPVKMFCLTLPVWEKDGLPMLLLCNTVGYHSQHIYTLERLL